MHHGTTSIAEPGHHGTHGHDEPKHASWLTLAIIALAQFMVILDVTVVNVALPSIGSDLRFDGSQLQWVVTAYVLFTGGLMLFGGRLADIARTQADLPDRPGRVHVGLADQRPGLVARGADRLTGVPGSRGRVALPSALAIVTTTYQGPQRSKALAIWGALGSAGAAAGVLFGGILTDTLGWEAIFFINVPVGIAVAIAAARHVDAGRVGRRSLSELDLPGAAALMAGLVALVLAIQGTSEHGWASAYTIGIGTLSLVLLTAFGRMERRSSMPLIPPATWRVRSLVSSAAVMLIATGILVGAFFLNTLYLQRVMVPRRWRPAWPSCRSRW